MNRRVVLETERLVLRHMHEGDVTFLRELVNEPAFLEFIGDRGVRSDEDAREYLENSLVALYTKHGFGLYLVEERVTGEPLGMCGLIQRDSLPDVDLGFAFLDRHRRKGFAEESSRGVLHHAEHSLGLRRIVAITVSRNTASKRLLEKLGFDYEADVRLRADSEVLELHALQLGTDED